MTSNEIGSTYVIAVKIGLQVLLVVSGLLLTLLVLLHKGKGGGLSDMFGGGMSSTMSGSSVAERNRDRPLSSGWPEPQGATSWPVATRSGGAELVRGLRASPSAATRPRASTSRTGAATVTRRAPRSPVSYTHL